MNDSASIPTQPATPPPGDPYTGKVIGERYRLLDRIGEGGMGAVYRAEHTLMRKTVACKLLHGELGRLEDMVRRFEREAQSASRLSHPNIISVTDFGRAASGELYLVMEYVPGLCLADVIHEARYLPVPRALAITRQILSALAHAHAQGVVHRDLKPANVMLTPSAEGRDAETVKILDFGVAKMTQGLAPGDRPLTQTAMVFGTPSYMSPEQATGQEVDPRTDLYACGVILYEMLTGRKPFVAKDLVKVLAMQVTARPPSFAEAAPEVQLPAALEAVVMRALEKDRTRRYPTAAAFCEALAGLELAMAPSAAAAAAVSGVRWLWARLRAAGRELGALHRRLPAGLRRWLPIAGVLGVVLLAVVPSFCYRAGRVSSAPPPPRPVAPAVQVPLQQADEALASGRLAEARARLFQLLSRFPREARVHYLLGHLEFLEKKPAPALAAYGQALDLDPGLRGDAALLLNTRALLGDKDKKLASAALALMAERIGLPAREDLAQLGTSDRRPEMRAAARAACQKVGCGAKLDLVESYALDLAQARSCDEKREAVRRLAGTGDQRAVEPLKKARTVRGPLGGILGGGNDCVRKDIDSALKELGG
jgi:eukaryotic-like serine/threonine-protein kinase